MSLSNGIQITSVRGDREEGGREEMEEKEGSVMGDSDHTPLCWVLCVMRCPLSPQRTI